MKKRIFTKLIASIIVIASFVNPWIITHAAENEIKVDIDGKFVEFDVPPIIENGRTLVPMRAIFEALGATVRWIPEEQQIEAIREMPKGTLKCLISLPDELLYIRYEDRQNPNDEQTIWYYSDFDTPPKIIDGRTLVPTRAVAEAFGAKVTWDGNTQTVFIDTAKATIVHSETKKSLVIYNPESVTVDENKTEPPKVAEPPKADEPFNLNEGDIAGNVVKDPQNYDSNYAKTFADAYRQDSIGQCVWYADSRFFEINGIRIPFGMGNAKEYIENGKNKDELLIITDINNIKSKSIAVFEHRTDSSHPGHVSFIEYIERDANGNPLYVYYSEANGLNDLNQGQYDYGYDGIVIKVTFEEFINHPLMNLLGYVCPNK